MQHENEMMKEDPEIVSEPTQDWHVSTFALQVASAMHRELDTFINE